MELIYQKKKRDERRQIADRLKNKKKRRIVDVTHVDVFTDNVLEQPVDAMVVEVVQPVEPEGEKEIDYWGLLALEVAIQHDPGCRFLIPCKSTWSYNYKFEQWLKMESAQKCRIRGPTVEFKMPNAPLHRGEESSIGSDFINPLDTATWSNTRTVKFTEDYYSLPSSKSGVNPLIHGCRFFNESRAVQMDKDVAAPKPMVTYLHVIAHYHKGQRHGIQISFHCPDALQYKTNDTVTHRIKVGTLQPHTVALFEMGNIEIYSLIIHSRGPFWRYTEWMNDEPHGREVAQSPFGKRQAIYTIEKGFYCGPYTKWDDESGVITHQGDFNASKFSQHRSKNSFLSQKGYNKFFRRLIFERPIKVPCVKMHFWRNTPYSCLAREMLN